MRVTKENMLVPLLCMRAVPGLNTIVSVRYIPITIAFRSTQPEMGTKETEEIFMLLTTQPIICEVKEKYGHNTVTPTIPHGMKTGS
uniref:Uncharacterized protein n=1 Tax=Arion vulgaris TaxID=1028688 RepID=A0A0B6YXT9_9EUPU